MEIRNLLTYLGYKYDNTGIKAAETDVNNYKSGILGLVSVTAAAVAAFAHTITSAIDFGNELSLTSQKLGINVQQLQEFEFAAASVDVSAEKFSLSLGILSKNLLSAQAGSKGALKAFRELKIEPKGFKDSSDLIFKIADKFAALPDSYKKAGIAKELFGRGGLSLIPFLDLGADRIRALGKTARDLNVVMGTDTVKAAREAHESMFELGFLLKSLERGIGATFIPAINKIVQGMIKFFEANAKVIGSGIKSFFEGVGVAANVLLVAFESLGKTILILLKPFGPLEKYIKYLTGPLGFLLVARLVTALVPWLGSLATSILGVDAAALPWLGTILLIAGALTGLYLIVEDLVYFVQGKPSLLGDIIGDKDQKKVEKYRHELEKIYELLLNIANFTTGGIAHLVYGAEGIGKRVEGTELIPRASRDYGPGANAGYSAPSTSVKAESRGRELNFNIPITVNNGDAAFNPKDSDKMMEDLKQVIAEYFEDNGYGTQRNFLPQLR